MKRAIAAIVLLAVVFTSDSSARAQFRRRAWVRGIAIDTGLRLATGGYQYGYPYYYYGYPYYGYGYPRYGYPYGGPTAYGNYARGMAQVVRARGQAARDYTQAQINRQVALSKYLENQKKWNEIYQARKQAAEEARRKKREERKRAAEERRSRPSPPQARITFQPGDRDPETGQLNWPEVLQSSEFAAQRKAIQEQFDLKAKTQATPAIKSKVIDTAMDMKTALRAKVNDVPINTLLAGLNYLDRVMHEAGR